MASPHISHENTKSSHHIFSLEILEMPQDRTCACLPHISGAQMLYGAGIQGQKKIAAATPSTDQNIIIEELAILIIRRAACSTLNHLRKFPQDTGKSANGVCCIKIYSLSSLDDHSYHFFCHRPSTFQIFRLCCLGEDCECGLAIDATNIPGLAA